MKFYAYLYLREDRTPYYAGKGTGKRAFATSHCVPPPRDKSRILIFPQSSEVDAFALEMAFIRVFGRKDLGTGCLRNATNGGEGSSGYAHTPATKLKQSQIKKAAPILFTDAYRLKLRLARAGRTPSQGMKHTDDWKSRHRAVMTGNTYRKGIAHSAESRQKMSKAHKGKPWTAARRKAQEEKKNVKL